MEGYDAATYGDRFADVYDEWYPTVGTDTDACVAALADLLPPPDRLPRPVVLELAVGTGRVALPLARRGYDVRGIDASAAMLERLAAKPDGARVATLCADMAAPVLPRRADDHGDGPRADLVHLLQNTVFALPGPAIRRQCLAGVRALLTPETGRFVVDAFVPPDDGATDADAAVTIRTLTADRVVLSAARRDRDAGTMSGQFIDIIDGSVRLRPWHLHVAGPAELDADAAASGLRLVDRWADWSRAPFTAASTAHVSVYAST